MVVLCLPQCHTMVRAGVLSVPYALSELGRGPRVAILILSWIITLYSLWQMVEKHEMVLGRRFDRYHELGQHAFGERLGLFIVVPQQVIWEVGVCIMYMVTRGKSLKKFHDTICLDLTYFIMIFTSIHFVLLRLPTSTPYLPYIRCHRHALKATPLLHGEHLRIRGNKME
ncbi:Lysine histidine transporter 1 [Platanthera guangdongensis]|uniref:Lysine histidine transporter 1 n=1 Tax=Platanthera guangdongensis TaxID=2320717 RepID=A0ABR2N2Y8_9ASPA